MENSDKIFDIQKKLFEEIQTRLPSQYILVDMISDILDTSRDSAYRRINCKKPLSIGETYTLCKHFQMSFDNLMDIRDVHQFDCVYRPIDLSISNEYQNYMFALAKNIEKLKNARDSSILMSAMDIPVFHLITQKELTFFKLYTWTQSVYNYEGTMDDFMKEIETPDILNCYRIISSNYELIPSAEIWTENTVNTTLSLINYYVEIGSFSNKELPLLLCEQVLNILTKMQKWAENSVKGERTTPFQLYISEMELENSYILMKQEDIINCVVKLFTINSLNVFDKKFCVETESWLTKLSQRSVLLCGSSEKDRIKYFNSQRQRVRFLMDKIKSL
ncbi:MAG: hypothetical protein FWH18_07265 [Marinilabiliaceae bacterium]|nr:hypothetical protein [Marinilabiliaceae bacterium]